MPPLCAGIPFWPIIAIFMTIRLLVGASQEVLVTKSVTRLVSEWRWITVSNMVALNVQARPTGRYFPGTAHTLEDHGAFRLAGVPVCRSAGRDRDWPKAAAWRRQVRRDHGAGQPFRCARRQVQEHLPLVLRSRACRRRRPQAR